MEQSSLAYQILDINRTSTPGKMTVSNMSSTFSTTNLESQLFISLSVDKH